MTVDDWHCWQHFNDFDLASLVMSPGWNQGRTRALGQTWSDWEPEFRTHHLVLFQVWTKITWGSHCTRRGCRRKVNWNYCFSDASAFCSCSCALWHSTQHDVMAAVKRLFQNVHLVRRSIGEHSKTWLMISIFVRLALATACLPWFACVVSAICKIFIIKATVRSLCSFCSFHR